MPLRELILKLLLGALIGLLISLLVLRPLVLADPPVEPIQLRPIEEPRFLV